jgi:hypothetical protein
MSLARREQRALRRIDRALKRSAPRVHAEFWVFGKRCSGQAMPGWEQLRPGPGNLWHSVQRLSHGTFQALMYAGGMTWPQNAADDHVA